MFNRNQLKEVTKITTFIEDQLEQIQDLKQQVQEAMFEDEKQVEEISKWSRQQARGIHSSERRTGNNDKKTQDC